jgi:hypothetical protein
MNECNHFVWIPIAFVVVFSLTICIVFSLAHYARLVRTKTPLLCDAGALNPSLTSFRIGGLLSSILAVIVGVSHTIVVFGKYQSPLIIVACVFILLSAPFIFLMALFSFASRRDEHNGAAGAFMGFGNCYSLWLVIHSIYVVSTFEIERWLLIIMLPV